MDIILFPWSPKEGHGNAPGIPQMVSHISAKNVPNRLSLSPSLCIYHGLLTHCEWISVPFPSYSLGSPRRVSPCFSFLVSPTHVTAQKEAGSEFCVLPVLRWNPAPSLFFILILSSKIDFAFILLYLLHLDRFN